MFFIIVSKSNNLFNNNNIQVKFCHCLAVEQVPEKCASFFIYYKLQGYAHFINRKNTVLTL